MEGDEFFQDVTTRRREFDANKTPVFCEAYLADQPFPRGAIHQCDDRVVTLLQTFGQFRHSSPSTAGKSGNSQHQLML